MRFLSNPPTRFFLLSGLALTIGTTLAIWQSPTSQAESGRSRAVSKPATTRTATHTVAAISQTSPSEDSVTIKGCRILVIKDNDITLASPVAGVLDFVTPMEGDQVQTDQEIAVLQDDVVEAQWNVAKKEAENDVEKRYAEKAAEVAEAELRKAQEANRRLRNSVPAVEIERLQLAAERARLQVEQAERQMEINQLRADEAEANFKTHHIRAPFNGTVTRKFKSRGEAVRQGDPILQIVSTDEVKVEGYVPFTESLRLNVGDKVEVQVELMGFKRDKPFEGVLTLKDPKVESIPGDKVRVAARVKNPGNILKAGLTATMKIIPQKGEGVQTTLLTR